MRIPDPIVLLGRRELCRRLPENSDFNVIPLGGEDIQLQDPPAEPSQTRQSLPWCRIPSKARWASQFPCVGQNQSVLPIPLRAVSPWQRFPHRRFRCIRSQRSNPATAEPSRKSSETNVWLNTSFALTILLFSAFIVYCVESANSIAYTHYTILFAICQCFCAIFMQIVHSEQSALIRLYFQWIKKHAPNDCLGRTIYSRTQDTYDPIRVLLRATNRTSPSTHAEITSPIPTARHRYGKHPAIHTHIGESAVRLPYYSLLTLF